MKLAIVASAYWDVTCERLQYPGTEFACKFIVRKIFSLKPEYFSSLIKRQVSLSCTAPYIIRARTYRCDPVNPCITQVTACHPVTPVSCPVSYDVGQVCLVGRCLALYRALPYHHRGAYSCVPYVTCLPFFCKVHLTQRKIAVTRSCIPLWNCVVLLQSVH